MNADVTLYSTRICPYCNAAKQLLSQKGVEYTDIPVDGDRALREEMIARSGRHTVPQIWIGERHVGGFDDLAALERAGQLDQILEAASAAS